METGPQARGMIGKGIVNINVTFVAEDIYLKSANLTMRNVIPVLKLHTLQEYVASDGQ